MAQATKVLSGYSSKMMPISMPATWTTIQHWSGQFGQVIIQKLWNHSVEVAIYKLVCAIILRAWKHCKAAHWKKCRSKRCGARWYHRIGIGIQKRSKIVLFSPFIFRLKTSKLKIWKTTDWKRHSWLYSSHSHSRSYWNCCTYNVHIEWVWKDILFIDTGYESIVRLLLENGVENIDAVNQGNNSALMFAAMEGNRNSKVWPIFI